MRRKGFTLIELLVVIAIIAILAAILFPVFAKAREKARQTSCLSNLKQLMLGMMMYRDDCDGRWPYTSWGNTVNAPDPNAASWPDGIFPYVKNKAIFMCPSNVEGAQCMMAIPAQRLSSPWYNNGSNTPGTGYGINECFFNCTQDARLKYPAETLILADCRCNWIGGYWSASFPGRASLTRVAMAMRWTPNSAACCNGTIWDDAAENATLHNGGSNLAFADGHVKWLKGQAVKTTTGGGSIRYYDFEW
jgi:prepilin-type N-terminal cleavage/methylation domain-containing protein/prepilin-type processing-associated H-X9-DG protein